LPQFIKLPQFTAIVVVLVVFVVTVDN